VKGRDEVAYRLGLAQGFLKESEQDFETERWRSCVDNAQLVAENSGKAVLALFGAAPKTHEPARALMLLLQKSDLPPEAQSLVQNMVPDLQSLGEEEHFHTRVCHQSPWQRLGARLFQQSRL
jgi:HEPN domain-containing protein